MGNALTENGGTAEPIVEFPPGGAYRLRFGVGNPFRLPGRTQVELRSTGEVRVATYSPGATVEDVTAVAPKVASSLVKAAAAAIVSRAGRTNPPPQPDEAIYLLEILLESESLGGVLVPERLLESVPRLQCLRCDLRRLTGVLGRHFL